jgi:tetratricopeptide (TPR) repeat protein
LIGRPASILCLLAAFAAGTGAAQRRPALTERGLDSLRLATGVDSVDAESYYRYGLGLWEKRRYDQADTAFRRALHFQPAHAGAHLALGALPYSRGSRYLTDLPGRIGRDSILPFLMAVQRHSRDAYLNDPTVDLASLRFLKEDELVPSQSGRLCFGMYCFGLAVDPKWLRPARKGVRFLVNGEADSAFTLMAAALNKRRPDEFVPDDFIWYFALSADRSGHPADAANAFRALAQRATRSEGDETRIGVSPRSRPMYLLLYGMASDRAGNVAVARAALREALLVDLTLYQAHSRLAEIAESQGDVEEAIAERRSAIGIAPEIGRLHIELGITLLQAGRTAEAKEALAEAVALAPWDPVAQLFLFQAAVGLNDRPTATRALESLERFAPVRNREQVAAARARLAELP